MPCTTRLRSLFALVSFTALLIAGASSQVNVTTYHNDNSRTGQNTAETVLTLQNVNSSTFSKLFTVQVDGQVYAQPLVLSNVSIGGGTHNVVYVATENDSVYALDANNGTVYWRVSLGTPEPQGSVAPNGIPASGCANITPQYGITSTPVIDPSTGTLYVVAENGAQYQLSALAVGTGAQKLGQPVTIAGTYNGVTFNALFQLIRPGLLLENGHVIIAAGSHCDNGPWYGWVFSYSASNLTREAVYNTEPTGNCAGIWMSGGGVAADSSGNLYLATGNSEEFTPPNYGDSILKLSSPSSGLSVLDYFTPSDAFNYADDGHDLDVGSGGVLLLPNTSLLLQMGKPGVLYLINTTTGHMGEYCSGCNGNDKNIVQEINGASQGVWGSMAYWNGNVYFGSAAEGGHDFMKAYSFNANGSGKLSTTPTSVSPAVIYWPSPTPSVSSNGTSNGIVWAVDTSSYASSCCATLHAYIATNISYELYNSNMVPGDQLGGATKFAVPTVANGKVYVGGKGANGTTGTLTAFGNTSSPRLYCTGTPTCSVQGQPQYGQYVVGGVDVSCTEATMLSASSNICFGSTCSSQSVSPPTPIPSLTVGGSEAGSSGSCSFTWSWGGNTYSQTLNVP